MVQLIRNSKLYKNSQKLSQKYIQYYQISKQRIGFSTLKVFMSFTPETFHQWKDFSTFFIKNLVQCLSRQNEGDVEFNRSLREWYIDLGSSKLYSNCYRIFLTVIYLMKYLNNYPFKFRDVLQCLLFSGYTAWDWNCYWTTEWISPMKE